MFRNLPEDATIEIYVNTVNSSNAPVAPSSAFVAGDFAIHKNGSATEKATANGITVTSPFGGKTGLHLIVIDTSNDTGDAGFWVSGARYSVRFATAKTVGGVSIDGRMVPKGQFGIESEAAATLTAATRVKLDTTQPDYAPAKAGDEMDLINGAITALKIGASALDGKGDWNTTTPPTAAQNRAEMDSNSTKLAAILVDTGTTIPGTLGTPAGVDVSADIAAVKADTGNLVTRITATLFSGITSMASWLGVGFGKAADAGTLAEINATTGGATYANTTDSQEAIRDRGDAAWTTGAGGGTGSGARTITVTVDDGTTALENAKVRFTEGVNTYVGDTDDSGNQTFNLDDATYVVAITKAGYTYGGGTLVVTADATPTFSMTANTSAPGNPALCNVSVTCLDEDGAVEAGVLVHAKIKTVPASGTGFSYDGIKQDATSDANGVAVLTLVREATYLVKRGPADAWTEWAVPDAATATLDSFIGADA